MPVSTTAPPFSLIDVNTSNLGNSESEGNKGKMEAKKELQDSKRKKTTLEEDAHVSFQEASSTP